MRDSYCHFRERHDVVTICYDYDYNTGTLRYGATIFRYGKKNDKWDRKVNNRYAYERMKNEPVVVQFGKPDLMRDDHVSEMGYFNYRRLENIIRKHLIPVLGVKFKQNKNISTKKLVKYKHFILASELSPDEIEYDRQHYIEMGYKNRCKIINNNNSNASNNINTYDMKFLIGVLAFCTATIYVVQIVPLIRTLSM